MRDANEHGRPKTETAFESDLPQKLRKRPAICFRLLGFSALLASSAAYAPSCASFLSVAHASSLGNFCIGAFIGACLSVATQLLVRNGPRFFTRETALSLSGALYAIGTIFS